MSVSYSGCCLKRLVIIPAILGDPGRCGGRPRLIWTSSTDDESFYLERLLVAFLLAARRAPLSGARDQRRLVQLEAKFRTPESLNSVRLERMPSSLDSLLQKQSIHVLLNNSGEENML